MLISRNIANQERSAAGNLGNPKWEMAYTQYVIMQNRLESCKVKFLKSNQSQSTGRVNVNNTD